MTRLLYLLPGLVPPGEDPARDKFTYLSQIASGDVLLPVWWKSPDSAPPYLRDTFPIYSVGSFRYHMFLAYTLPLFVRRFAFFLFYVRQGLQLNREKHFDAIIAYGTNTTAIAALVLKWFTGAKLIVEVPGVPENSFRYDTQHPGVMSMLKRFVANRLFVFVGMHVDCMKLLYPEQLKSYRSLRNANVSIFHDFVPVHTIQPSSSDERFILSVGYPFHTKGMDILLSAFKTVANEFPDYKLKLMGHFPDQRELKKLTSGYFQIEIVAPGSYKVALNAISSCSVYVLASRSEAMGRVLLEAMSARKPIVASAVGGVPNYIRDKEDGLLFESENVEDLAAKLKILLTDERLRLGLAEKGHARVLSQFDETAYVKSFDEMLRRLIEPAVHLNAAKNTLNCH